MVYFIHVHARLLTLLGFSGDGLEDPDAVKRRQLAGFCVVTWSGVTMRGGAIRTVGKPVQLPSAGKPNRHDCVTHFQQQTLLPCRAAGVCRDMLTFTKVAPWGKLVRVVIDREFDLIADVHKSSSPACGRWVGLELSADNTAGCGSRRGKGTSTQ